VDEDRTIYFLQGQRNKKFLKICVAYFPVFGKNLCAEFPTPEIEALPYDR
jgi:hypothetical protein